MLFLDHNPSYNMGIISENFLSDRKSHEKINDEDNVFNVNIEPKID